jgi:hypothetical protein
VNGGQSDWSTSFGLLYIYLDDLFSPIITTPLNLGATLNLDNGRAFVGFTASTGNEHFQVHDVLNWNFESFFIDKKYTKPTVVNGEGAQQCVNESVCLHPFDEQHFVRTNNVFVSEF